MGIKNLLKFLSYQNNIIKDININEYQGKKVAIDISILIYQVVISIRNSGADLTNNKGEMTSHLLGLFNKTINLIDMDIIPIFVFDGKPPLLKRNILDTRRKIKNKALLKLEYAKTEEDKIRCFKKCVYISQYQMNQCRELLTLMGIPFINAPEEADSELSYLCKNNLVYAVLTEDMDILTFGSTKIIRNLLSNKKQTIEINLNDILNNLQLNHEQFIELCILFGCDYCIHINNIQSTKIYEIYIKHKNIEDTLKEFKLLGYNIPNDYEYITAKEYFKSSVHSNVNNDDLKLKKPDIDELLNFLVNKHGFIKFKIINKINKLLVFYNKNNELGN